MNRTLGWLLMKKNRLPRTHRLHLSAVRVAGLTLLAVGLAGWIVAHRYPRSERSQRLSDSATSQILPPGRTGDMTDLPSTSGASPAKTQARVNESYGKLPLNFEANQGQLDRRVKFRARGNCYNLLLTSTEAVLALRKPRAFETNQSPAGDSLSKEVAVTESTPDVLRLRLVGARSRPQIGGVDELPGKSNYFIGNDPSKWRTNVPHYARVQYKDIYPGVNLIYYGQQRQLEYDFVVAPGADASAIKLAFSGSQEVSLGVDGDLILATAGGELRQHKPVVYQEVKGKRVEVGGRYTINAKREVGFEIAEYDTGLPLVIDPVLSYSTYLGGNDNDAGFGITVDSLGNAYVTGVTNSANFPAVNSLPHGPENAYTFITKLNAAGSALVYSTYVGGLGGASSFELGNSIAVDSVGNAYVTGSTFATDFPTVNAYQNSRNGGRDAFALKLSPTGSMLVYSTYLGGNADDEGRGIAVDATGNAYVIGRTVSTDFPTTNALQPVSGGNTCGPFNPCDDAFVTKFASSGSTLVYSTYLGGDRREYGNAIAVDGSDNAYVTGFTNSANFPTTANALQTNYSDQGTNSEEHDAFVTKLNPSGSAFVYSTYLGGSLGSDDGKGIAVDSVGNAYVAGQTNSGGFPTVNAVQPAISPGGNGAGSQFSDAFVSKLNPTGSALVYSTFLGGSQPDAAQSIAIDSAGNAYVTGYTLSFQFPLADPFQPNTGGDFAHTGDAFVTKLSAAGSALVYSSFLGGGSIEAGNGIAVDSTGSAYVTGYTGSQDFPTANPMQTTFGGGNFYGDAFVTKISNSALPATLSLSAVQPDRGGNTGFVTVTLHGNGFASGATVKLVHAGQPDITATSVTVSHNSTVAETLFDLTSQAPGVRDVVLINPDNSSATRAAAFTVEAGGEPYVWVDIIGRGEMRPGQPQTYYIFYGNRGNVDGYKVPLYIAFDKRIAWKRKFTIATPILPPGVDSIDSTQTPITYDRGELTYMLLRIIKIAPGVTGVLSLQLTLPNDWPRQDTATVKAWVEPHPKSNPPPQDDCRTSVARAGLSIGYAALGFVLDAGCLTSGMSLWSEHQLENSEGADSRVNSELQSDVAAAAFAAHCAHIPAAPLEVLGIGLNIGSAIVDCTGVDEWLQKHIFAIFGIDPNDKVGAQGAGTAHYLSGEEPLRYAIYFENKPEATGSAQTVVVTDQLDAAKFDLKTFSLGPIAFGVDKNIIPPSGLSEFKKDVDLRPAKNLIVRVEAKLDKPSGLLTWRFTSLDPATGLPTEDPTAGFLPPNRTAPEGEGQVLFTVRPKESIVTGTEFRNKARIVFDTNAPIDTPEWLNTVDNSKPVSHVLQLQATQSSIVFNVVWTGMDTGSGVQSYSVYSSENGAPFTSWLVDTTATSGSFIGQPGKTYSFYTIARDATGNLESAKTAAETTTTTTSTILNSVDDQRFFVYQHYSDFLSRTPDQEGWDYWTSQITQCGANSECTHDKRVDVSNAFFFELEYQQTGAYVFRLYRASYGNNQPFPNPGNSNSTEGMKLPSYAVFSNDRARVVGGPDLAQSQLALATIFVQRPEFLAKYPANLDGPAFVDAVLATINNDSGVDLTSQRGALINLFNSGGRGAVVYRLADDNEQNNPIDNRAFIDAEYNRAFVATEYFGYLRRDADIGGFLFWLGQVNSAPLRNVPKQHAMVCSFITSAEYQNRFGSVVTHTNAECPQ
jgi:hypothetical protein